MNWGIIGLGNIAKRFATSLIKNEDAYLYAVASYTEEKRDYFKKTYAPEVVYNDYESLLNDYKVEAVYIALPHAMHKEYIIKALEKKIAVLCEKPATMNAEDLIEIKKIAKENKTFFMEAIKTRFCPLIDDIKHAINEEKIIGDITTISANFNSDVGEVVEGRYYIDPTQGGALYDVGIYPVNFVIDMLGNEIVEIKSTMKSFKNYQTDDYFSAKLTFESGVVACVEGAMDRNEPKVAIIQGTKGKIVVPVYYRPESYHVELNDGISYTVEKTLEIDDMQGEIQEVQNCFDQLKMESERLTIDESIKMIQITDQIRKKAKWIEA